MTLTGLSMMAKPVEPEKAVQVAKNFMAQYVKGADKMEATVSYTHPMSKSGQPAMYVVNLGSAFVIVSADDVAHPVLGYSTGRAWPTKQALPSQVTAYLDDLAAQIEAATTKFSTPNSQFSIEETSAEWQQLLSINSNLFTTPNLPDSVGPLLTTTWNQGQYYNALCPEDAAGPAGHCVTGCVATAMAQIINYWGYPVHGRGIHSYNSNYGALSVNYDSATYDYAHMPNALTATSTPQEVNAVATLMRDCGVAANMGYGSNESSSYDIDARAGLINFFRLSSNLSYAEKSFFADSVWLDMLRTDIAANRPVMYSGQGDAGGHSFVCDGYKQNGYFHFNFGWSGYADGWYLTSAINPAGMAFNSDQSALLGIVPDSTSNVILGQMAGTSTFIVDDPLEFYHLLGHNAYTGTNYSNTCDNTVNFISDNSTNQLVADIIEFEDQNLTINDGNGAWLRSLYGGSENNSSPVVSSSNALSINYSGNLYYAGFQLAISQDNGCRMVSNIIASVDTTTVHLMWTENGTATQWQIEYGEKGFIHGNGLTYTSTTNTATFSSLQKFTEYDFYIRPICGAETFGPWNKQSVMVEAAYWQDIVTDQPTGYYYNSAADLVEISTAEGLAWWAKNGCYPKAYLTEDINLYGYKWRPTNLVSNLYGQRHVISNVYINETTSDVGLFSDCSPGIIIENLGLINAYVKSSSYRVGGLFGTFRGIMRNCYVRNSSIDGGNYSGGLIGESDYGTVTNCFVNVNVVGNNWTGLMIGNSWQGINHNCYAAGNVRHRSYCYIGGIAAYAGAGEITNCYSVETDMGVVGFKGITMILDTSTFLKHDAGCTLLTPIVFDNVLETDLLTALNRGVANLNDSIYCTWIADTGNTSNGYPILGDNYEVLCSNVSNISISNINVGNRNAVVIGWTENGNATQWRVRYRRHDMLDSAYTYITLANNPDTIFNITLGYAYDFNVRAICDTNNVSGWSPTYTMIVDLPYWTDIVTSQPSGFIEDSNGNVEISSAEGLAWLAVMVNGFNGQTVNTYEGKTVVLTADINLEGYRWYPMGRYNYINFEWTKFSGTFEGQGHSVSNIYVKDAWSDLGLFGRVDNGRIRNVNIEGGTISSIYTDRTDAHALHSSALGGLIGYAFDCYEITNCHSSATIYANGGAGSLCGEIRGDLHNTIVSNCSASGTVYGRESCGGLIGDLYGTVEVRNCYATGDVNIASGSDNAWYRGGLIGNFMYAKAANCYSTGSVTNDPNSYGYYGKVIGCPYRNTHIHYVYGQENVNVGWELIGNYCEDISDTSQFHHSGVTNTLLTSVSIGGTSHNDLLDALNAWVTSQNDPTLRTWVIDSITGYPVFGDDFVPSCYNPTDFTVSQATIVGDSIIRTQLSWTQVGEPDHWEILYVATEKSIDSGIIVQVSSNPCVLTDIPVGHPLDFYVRAVCDNNDMSNWSTPITYIPDKLRWTEVVTSQPEGYTEDANGNVYISSAEGLAWLSSVSNGLNGVHYDQGRFWDKKIVLTSDIDISAYRWVAIGRDWAHLMNGAQIKGNNHVIVGLYCNELEDYQGLFGYLLHDDISNLIINQCNVYGENRTGAIAGYALYSNFLNCAARGNVYGIEEVGGIVGRHEGNGCSIKNTWFVGFVTSRRDMTKVNSYSGYVGGISGTSFYDTIVNCYTVSEIPSNISYPGIITGTGGRPNLVSNCYYKDYETNLPITSDNCIVANNSSFTGSSTTWTLSTPPFVNGSFYSNLVDALNAWVDANNAEGQYRHWATDSTSQNGGYPVFAYVPCTPATGSDSITVCDSYTWHGTTYTADAVLIDTLSTLNGCDSIVTHYLTVNHSNSATETTTACESYFFGGQWLYASGQYSDTLTNIAGCDSIVTLTLTINNPVHTATTVTACDSYTWNGATITTSGDYTYPHNDDNGCTQVDTLHLTINHSTSSIVTDTACEAYFWNGEWRYSSGQYSDTLTNAAGCDSIVTLTLTINNPFHTATTVTACDSYTWQEAVITTSGTYHYTHTDANGCTQDDTLYLTINHNDTVIVDEEVCDSLTWYGVTYTASAYGVQYLTVPNAVGCDSIFFLDLTVNYTTYGEMSAVSCDSYQWDWNGAVYTASGDYTYRDTVNMNSQFCDSVLTLHLTVNYSATSDTTATACDMFVWYGHMGYDVSGDYEHRWWNVTADGCDSILTLHLTINRSAETTVTDTAEASYSWHGETYTESGTYTWTGTTAEGCDSTVTLVLTVTQVGIEDVEVGSSFNIFVSDGRIVVEGATGEEVGIFDMIGRQILREDINSSLFTLHSSLSAGVYLVKVGSLPARKVVVIR